jgi:DNA-binding transcriptional ArsR family regulator
MIASMTLDTVDQLKVLLAPPRVELMTRMATPTTCPQLGKQLSMTPQKIYYHVKALEKAGLVRKVREERVKGIMQGVYQASAHSIALSPRLVARLGGRKALTSSVSLSRLLDAADQIVRDVQVLSERNKPASLTIDTTINLAPGHRVSFLRDAGRAIEDLARRYTTAGEAQPFRLLVACYESPDTRKEE